MGVVLTMTMVMITALAVTREHERGTMRACWRRPLPLSHDWQNRAYIFVG
jgi:hypothetical protein